MYGLTYHLYRFDCLDKREATVSNVKCKHHAIYSVAICVKQAVKSKSRFFLIPLEKSDFPVDALNLYRRFPYHATNAIRPLVGLSTDHVLFC